MISLHLSQVLSLQLMGSKWEEVAPKERWMLFLEGRG